MVTELKREYIYKLSKEGKRIDGREFDEYRNISIEKGVIKKAEGSARIRLGDTEVFAGVKMEMGEPYPDSPDCGVLTTSAELVPLASPTFETGPPSPFAIELARVADRGVRESKCIDFKKLCITKNEKVWIIFLDIHLIDDNGNLFDASSLASISAMSNTIIPASKYELGEDKKLSIERYPISCTFVKLGDEIVLDPSLDEETCATTRFTVSIDENDIICAMQKGGSGSFIKDEIKYMIDIAKRESHKIRKQVMEI